MAVIVHASEPRALLSAIRSAVRSGEVAAWSEDEEGDFNHTPELWARKAWFRAKVSDGRIVFNILTPHKLFMKKITYALYHGRFIEMLLAYFGTQFQRVVATALPEEGDDVKG
jgi:hypothetical protein